MTFNELLAALLQVVPDAEVHEDRLGQLVVETNMMIESGSDPERVVAFVTTKAEQPTRG